MNLIRKCVSDIIHKDTNEGVPLLSAGPALDSPTNDDFINLYRNRYGSYWRVFSISSICYVDNRGDYQGITSLHPWRPL